MKDIRNTIILAAIALVSIILAVTIAPESKEPEFFNDQGQELFPKFKDPTVVSSLEVMEWNEGKAQIDTFKVDFDKKMGWLVPSKYNYPADAEYRLGTLVSNFLDLKKDRIVSDKIQDHPMYKVVDPNPEGRGDALEGIGRRITMKAANQTEPLFDLIIGKEVEDHREMRYVRLPGSNRVYACTVTDRLSTKFAEWIKTDLLDLSQDVITEIVLNNYSVDEARGAKTAREIVSATKTGTGFGIAGLAPDEEVKKDKMSELVSGLDFMKIVDVLPKPDPFTSAMRQGFFRDQAGNMAANEGEVVIRTKKGITYNVYFGEVAGVAGGQSAEEKPAATDQENRYIIVETSYKQEEDTENVPPQPEPENTPGEGTPAPEPTQKKEPENKNLDQATKLSENFAGWIYVISDADYKKIHKSRADLVKKVEKTEEAPKEAPIELPKEGLNK